MSDLNIPVGLEIKREHSAYDVGGRTPVYRLRIDVTRYSNIDPNVFVYDVVGPDLDTDTKYARFNRVASAVDLEEYPVGIPEESDTAVAYFRLAEVDLLFRSMTDLDAAWEAIRADQEELVRAMNQLTNPFLNAESYNAVGDFPADEVVPEPEASSSSGAIDCSGDLVLALEITASDDPEFPVGTILQESITSAPTPENDCLRDWAAAADVTPDYELRAVSSLVANEATFTFDHPVFGVITVTAGIADDYQVILVYEVGGIEYTLTVDPVYAP